ncbi:MAG: KpsF/GutQ family sugar-phosphate isomerase [Rhizobiaceae bacterium]|nr:KpsF/GutQ family sugar-phosphate isomerase [Rhizobiaceae bacterium]
MNASQNTVSALRTIRTEITGLETLADAIEGPLGEAIDAACATIRDINGRVIVTGVGKSGHVGGKLAATLASTGTPSFFVHPAEANHGDLGMIARDDAVIALSWSGETTELKGVLAYTSRFSIPLIAITRNSESALGREATICLELPKVEEACPNGLAPTTSTIMQMAIGDALAVSLLEGRGFSADDFGIYHPGGSLGSSLTRVSEIMHKGESIPLVPQDTAMPIAIMTLSEKRFGCVGVTNDSGELTGILTDGDLARNLDKDLQKMRVDDLMTRNPKTVSQEMLVNSALATLNEFNISALIVTDESSATPVGIIHLHDLLRIGAA